MIDLILAQATQPVVESTGLEKLIHSPVVPILLFGFIFYVFVIRGKKKENTNRKNMLSEMKKGDRVQTIGGILANVVETRDDRILLKVDETSNTKIWFARAAIHKVLGDEKTETK